MDPRPTSNPVDPIASLAPKDSEPGSPPWTKSLSLPPGPSWPPAPIKLKAQTVNQEYHIHKLPFRNEGEIKTFPDKQKLTEVITTRHTSQEMLKGVLNVERKDDIATTLNI